MITYIKQWFCNLCGGHDAMKHCVESRVFVRCDACGWESPGIDCPKMIEVK